MQLAIISKNALQLSFITLTLITASCGVSSKARTTLSQNKNGTTPNSSLYGSPFHLGVSDSSGGNYSSQEQQRPSSGPLVQPSAQLSGMTPWDYMNARIPAPQIPQMVEPRAVVTPGKYKFVVGPRTGVAQNHTYTLNLPQTVEFVYNEPGCAASPQGYFVSQTVLCLRFTQASLQAPLPIRMSVQGPQINATQTLWVLVLPAPTRPSEQLRIVVNGGALQGPPPVVINHKVYVNESDSRSQFQVMPSEFSAVVQGQMGQLNLTSLTVEPASSGSAGRINNTNEFRVSITRGGPVRLIARGNDNYGFFEVTLNVAVPRLVNGVWTRNVSSRPAASSSEVSGLVCLNSSTSSVTVQIAPEQTASFALNLPAYRSDIASNTFVPTFDWGFGLIAARATVSVDGNAPVGAVRCRAVTYSCADMSRNSCITTLRQDFWLGREAF